MSHRYNTPAKERGYFSICRRLPTGLSALLLAIVFLNPASCKKEVPLSERFAGYDESSFVATLGPLKAIEGRDGLTIGISAESCRGCHSEIYKEWSQTTHATALRDIQYQAELAKESSPKWLCLNCHIPLQNQRSYMVQGDTKLEYHKEDIRKLRKVENPGFSAELQKEAITCAVCHIRADENGKSYMIGASGTTLAPHPVKQDPEFLRNICMRCHQPGDEGLTSTFACWFQTKEELDEGPYKGEKDCVDCHMPVANRRSVPHNPELPVREGHMHHWAGGGVPKWYEDYDSLIERGYEPGLTVDSVKAALVKDQVEFSATYKNARAGHWLPTGDPERFLLFRAAMVDEAGKEVSLLTMRVGQEWDWGDASQSRPAEKIHDNRLKPLEERTWSGSLHVDPAQKGQKLVITVYHVRLNSKNAEYMMGAQDIDEGLLPNGGELVKNAGEHYPFASYIYRQEIDPVSGLRRIYSLEELIELSKREKGKQLSERVY